MIKIDADRSFCKRAQLEAARATMKVIPFDRQRSGKDSKLQNRELEELETYRSNNRREEVSQ
jgi:hypothetical protein